MHKPISIDHSPAHSHPRTQCWKTYSSSRRYIWFQSIFQLLKVKDNRKIFFQFWKLLTMMSHPKLVQLSPFQTSFSCQSNKSINLLLLIAEFSIDVLWNKSATQLQPADIICSESSISSKTRKSLRHQSFLPIPAHQPIKGIYHGVSSGQTTVLFVAS